MAQTPIGTLVVSLIANTAQFQAGLNNANRAASTFATSVRATLAGLGATLSVAGLVALVKSSLEAADSLDKMATRVGVGVEQLQELVFAAKSSGVGMATLDTSLSRLNQRIGDSVAGNKEATDAFKRIGVSVRDANDHVKDAGQLFPEIADKIQRAGDATERAAIANAAFGRGGQALIPVLIEGAAGLERFAQKARELGVVLDASVIREGVRAKDA